jgi:hypothetical protein
VAMRSSSLGEAAAAAAPNTRAVLINPRRGGNLQ